MPDPAGRREERRKNLVALAIAGLVVVLVGVAIFRPAAYPFVPVGKGALAESLHGKGDAIYPARAGKCSSEGNGRFQCDVSIPQGSSSTSVNYVVETSWTGCWQATPARPGSHSPPLDGCIWILDY